jgi:hypothetical protein
MSSRTFAHVGSFVALALLVAVGLGCRSSEPLPSTDQPLGVLARPTLEGPVLDVAPFAGKVVLVNFWSPT